MDLLNQGSALLDMIANHPLLSTALGLGLIEAALRMKQTQKVVSLLVGLQALLKGGIKLAQSLDNLLSKLIPHKLAEPAALTAESSERK